MSVRRVGLAAGSVAAVAIALVICFAQGASATHRHATASPARQATAEPQRLFVARRLRARPHAVAVGTAVRGSGLSTRVFADASDGFALAQDGSATYPARTTDGGHVWRIDGPQFHVDAADAPEAVGYVGLISPRVYYAYGSSVVDVTTDAGRTWWETFMGSGVAAVVSGPKGQLLAYVDGQRGKRNPNHVVIWQYVSVDGGRRWHYTTQFF